MTKESRRQKGTATYESPRKTREKATKKGELEKKTKGVEKGVLKKRKTRNIGTRCSKSGQYKPKKRTKRKKRNRGKRGAARTFLFGKKREKT